MTVVTVVYLFSFLFVLKLLFSIYRSIVMYSISNQMTIVYLLRERNGICFFLISSRFQGAPDITAAPANTAIFKHSHEMLNKCSKHSI